MTSNTQYVLGIDPGATGAACLLRQTSDGPEWVSVLPFKDVDDLRLIDWFATIAEPGARVEVLIERTQAYPNNSPHSNYTLGYETGLVLGVCRAIFRGVRFIHPKKWQGAYFPAEGAATYAQRKSRNHKKAQALYPTQKILKPVADAVLIAHYAAVLENPTVPCFPLDLYDL